MVLKYFECIQILGIVVKYYSNTYKSIQIFVDNDEDDQLCSVTVSSASITPRSGMVSLLVWPAMALAAIWLACTRIGGKRSQNARSRWWNEQYPSSARSDACRAVSWLDGGGAPRSEPRYLRWSSAAAVLAPSSSSVIMFFDYIASLKISFPRDFAPLLFYNISDLLFGLL